MAPQPFGSAEPPPSLVERRVTLVIDPAQLRGTWTVGEPAETAILLDGVVQAIVPAGPCGFAWDIPPHVFGRLLDIVATENGASFLAAPADLSAVRAVHWTQWALGPGGVSGSFQADATDAATLPVGFVADGIRYASGFAHRLADGAFAFEIPLHRLPSGLGGLALQPAIGTLVLPPVLHIPAEAFGHVGMVETGEPWRVRGWAAGRHAGGTVPLDLFLDGAWVRSFPADRPRTDVGALGYGDRAGFDEPVSAPLDRAVLVDVRVSGGPSLGGSPYVRPAAPRHVGYLDRADEFSASGWALDLQALDRPVRVEAVCDGEIVGTGLANLDRGDVAEAGLPTARCGFTLSLSHPGGSMIGRAVSLIIAGTSLELPGSPQHIALNPNAAAFLQRRPPPPPLLARIRRRLTHRVRDVLVSIVMPVHETRRDWLLDAIGSVTAQWSDNWELICVDDGSAAPHVQDVMQAAARDERVRVIRLAQNGGTARATNAGLHAARGDYVAFLDHDDALEPDAVYHLSRAAQQGRAGLIYSDEVVTGSSLADMVQLRARPAWSHDYYLSHPYFVHLVAVRRDLALSVGGLDESLPVSADVDFVLRVAERTPDAIAHVPRVLYRWRTHRQSAGHRQQAEVMAATQGAIGRHLARLGQPATVTAGLGFNQFRLDWPDDGGEVLIVIPTKNRVDLLRRCIESVEATTQGERYRIVVVDHQSTDPASVAYLASLSHTVMPYTGAFNFSAINNLAVRTLGGASPYVLFLNNDVEAVTPGWLGRLRSLAARPEVGAVGPLLLYGDGRIQHAGVIIGFGGTADHAMRFVAPDQPDGSRDPGYNAGLTSLRDYSAVTAACMMMRRPVFDRLGGFDEALAVGFNDTDLCLRLRAAGLRVLYDGHTVLKHHESATRGSIKALADPPEDGRFFRQRWAAFIRRGDPFYNPALSLTGVDHRLRHDRIHPRSLDTRFSGRDLI